MKIAVCVKHVPNGRLRLAPGSNRLDRSGSGELNSADAYAIEEALRLREELQGEIVVVTLGPDQARESLRTAFALGADRGVLIDDPDAEGSDLIASSKILAAALAREQPDLTLFGQQSSDGAGAMLWAAVGELLGMPIVSQALRLAVAGGVARVDRQTEYADEVIEAALPAIVAVTDAINLPRYPSLKGMMNAKRKPIETLSLKDLDIEPSQAGLEGSWTAVLGVAEPPRREGATRIEDDGRAAEEILAFLAARNLV